MFNKGKKKLVEKQLTGLRKFKFIMAAFHGLQAIAIIVLSKSFNLPISGNYLSFNERTKALEPAVTNLFTISLPVLIAVFLFLSSAAHLFIIACRNL